MCEEKEYKNRLIDDKIKEYLNIFGALIIEGPINYAIKDPETGIYILHITALKP